MKTLFVTLIIASVSMLYANVIGIVQKVDGIVKVKHKDSIKKEKLKPNYEIQEGDIISTFRNAKAVLELKDKSHVVLGSKATIVFNSPTNLEQNEGKIYYKITSRDAKNKLKIKTNFAIIGIKGTTFVVSSEQNSSYVALKEGLIGVASIKEQFRLYKQKVMDEYQKFLAQQQMEFEKFKNGQIAEYVGEAKEFDLKEGNVVSFDGDKAIEAPLDTEKDFESFEALLK